MGVRTIQKILAGILARLISRLLLVHTVPVPSPTDLGYSVVVEGSKVKEKSKLGPRSNMQLFFVSAVMKRGGGQ